MTQSQWSSMDRDAKVGAIYRLAKKDMTAAQIAEELGTTPKLIHDHARLNNIVICKHVTLVRNDADPIPVYSTGPLWERSDDAKRRAFHARQRRGVREALRATA